MDRLSDRFHLIYYDQRGRGQSADGVKPEDVTLASDIADIEKVGSIITSTQWSCWDTPGAQCLLWNTRFAIRAAYLIDPDESCAGIRGRLQAAKE